MTCFAKASRPVPNGEAKGTALVLPGTVVTNIIADIVRLKIWKGKVLKGSKESEPWGP
jgi:hypothetical protein